MQDSLLAKLQQLRRRQALVQALEGGLKWGSWGAWLCIPLLLISKAAGLNSPELLRTLCFWPTLTCLGLIHGFLHPPSLASIAHSTDVANGLQEKLLTCLQYLRKPRTPTSLSDLLFKETLEQLKTVDPALTFPLRWKQAFLYWSVAALAVLFTVNLSSKIFTWSKPEPLQQEVIASQQRLHQLEQKLSRHNSHQQKLQRLLHSLPQQVPAQAAKQMQKLLSSLQKELAQHAAQARTLNQLAHGNLLKQDKQLEQLRQQLDQAAQAKDLVEQAQQALRNDRPEAAQKALLQAQQELTKGQLASENQQLSQALANEISQLGGMPKTEYMQESSDQTSSYQIQITKNAQAKSPGDFGIGSTNQAQTANTSSQPKAHSQRQNTGERHKQETFKQLYDSRRKQPTTQLERVRLSASRGKLLTLPQNRLEIPQPGEPTQLQTTENFLVAKVLSEQSVAEEKIPVEHREAVRHYFDQIDPRH